MNIVDMLAKTAAPVQLVVIQPTPFCNIQCDYCYLPDKDSTTRIQKQTFINLVSTICSSKNAPDILSLVWHAGEPLTLPPSFYSELLNAATEIGIPPTRIRNSVQTNGTLISHSWCEFFLQHHFRVGVSIDGPAHIHDAHRVDRGGRPTHYRVMKGIELLRKHDIDFHVIAVVTSDSLDYAEEIYDFFLNLGVTQVGFNIEEIESHHAVSSLDSRAAEDRVLSFWRTLYARQLANDNQLMIREFVGAYNKIRFGKDIISVADALHWNAQVSPFSIISVDCFGNLSSFSPELIGSKSALYGDFIFGNVNGRALQDDRQRSALDRAAIDIKSGIETCKQQCQYFKLCGGGAPSNKFYENRRLDSAETMYCRTSIQMPIDVVLADLEARVNPIERS